jgi:hypothetical protein
MTDQPPATAPVTAQDTPGGPGRPTGGPETPQTALQRLRRLRGQLAAEHAKAVAADQAALQRPDRADLRVNPHNGTAAGLEIAVGLADHHLREAGEEAGERHATRAALIRDQAALAQIRLLIAAHRPRLKLADPILLGRLERVLEQPAELEAAQVGE